MKNIDDDELRTNIIETLYKTDGDRNEAAKLMKTTRRTLDRWIKVLRMYPDLDAMGWVGHRGPPRVDGTSEPSRTDRVYDRVRTAGYVNVAELVKAEYGEDTLGGRATVYNILTLLTRRGLLTHVSRGRWELPGGKK